MTYAQHFNRVRGYELVFQHNEQILDGLELQYIVLFALDYIKHLAEQLLALVQMPIHFVDVEPLCDLLPLIYWSLEYTDPDVHNVGFELYELQVLLD